MTVSLGDEEMQGLVISLFEQLSEHGHLALCGYCNAQIVKGDAIVMSVAARLDVNQNVSHVNMVGVCMACAVEHGLEMVHLA